MLVITAQVGFTTAAMRAISPGMLTPISTTAAVWSFFRPHTVMGTPTWLFWFPAVFSTRNLAVRAWATISLAVVLPTLPVTPTTGMANCSRYQAAAFCKASRQSFTRTMGFSPRGISWSVKVAAAGLSSTAGM